MYLDASQSIFFMVNGKLSESLFYVAELNGPQSLVTLSADESHHAIKVFRHRTGDVLRIGNGNGQMGLAELIECHPQGCVLKVIEQTMVQPPPFRWSLAQCLLKEGDNEDVVEHVAQTDVERVILLRSIHCRIPVQASCEKTMHRCQAKAMVAFKQSAQAFQTTIEGPHPLLEWAKNWVQSGHVLWVTDQNGAPISHLQASLPTQGKGALVIGPEGGLHNDEIKQLQTMGASLLSLGTSRLRARTAGLFALGGILLK